MSECHKVYIDSQNVQEFCVLADFLGLLYTISVVPRLDDEKNLLNTPDPTMVSPEAAPGHSQAVRAQLRLREMVLAGELSAGSRIAELTLVELLGVSRTPIRTALMKLEQEGLLAGGPVPRRQPEAAPGVPAGFPGEDVLKNEFGLEQIIGEG